MAQQLAQYGAFEEIDGGYRLRFERHLNHSADKVWTALTSPDCLKQWLAAAVEFDLVEGGSVVLEWQNTDQDGNVAVARGTISRLEPPHLIEFDTDIHGRITWELQQDGDGCTLYLTVSHDLPYEYLAIVLAGWHVHLDFLDDVLNGQAIDWPNWPIERWKVHHKRYSELIG